MVGIAHIIPCHITQYAVFAGRDDEPYFRKVFCFGLAEVRNPKETKCGPVGYTSPFMDGNGEMSPGIGPADLSLNFLGYSDSDQVTQEWCDKAKERAVAIRKRKLELAQQKLYVPTPNQTIAIAGKEIRE